MGQPKSKDIGRIRKTRLLNQGKIEGHKKDDRYSITVIFFYVVSYQPCSRLFVNHLNQQEYNSDLSFHYFHLFHIALQLAVLRYHLPFQELSHLFQTL